jgi:peptidoglycan/xylan/chitin deacetylase (PgdA/CDA1 family)
LFSVGTFFYMINSIHFILKKIYPNFVWELPNDQKKVYLTFDDGPIPEVTEWVLNELQKHNAKATFFCIGDNVQKHPEVFAKIVNANHALGNHTFNHLNSWNTSTENYLQNIDLCQTELEMNNAKTLLFRPPYGKITSAKAKKIQQKGLSVVMWGIIAKDYDKSTTKEACVANVLDNVKPGSIIVMHDSLKAFPNLKYALPLILKKLSEKGYSFDTITYTCS